MRQDATNRDRELPDLPPRQTKALGALLGGATITAAAEVAGVERSTLYRWLKHDHTFRAAHNGLRRDLRREVQIRIDQILSAAVETVSAAIESGDVRAALAVLRGAGILAGERPRLGPEDPQEVEEEAELARLEREGERRQRRMMAF